MNFPMPCFGCGDSNGVSPGLENKTLFKGTVLQNNSFKAQGSQLGKCMSMKGGNGADVWRKAGERKELTA